MKLFGCILCLTVSLFLPIRALANEEGAPVCTPVQIQFFPTLYYVGDRVTLRFTFSPPNRLSISPPPVVPSVPWGVVRQVKAAPSERGVEVTIVFTPYRPGTHEIPRLHYGSVWVEPVKVQVSSLMDTAKEVPHPILGQEMVPSTKLLVLGTVSGALFAMGLFLRKRVGKAILGVLRWYQGKTLYRRITNGLAQLEAQALTMDERDFYIELHERLRHYLCQRFTPSIRAYTTAELGTYFQNLEGPAQDVLGLMEVFRRGDLVKYAGLRIGVSALRKEIGEVQVLLERIEQRYWKTRGEHKR